jgi:hypothetical protein
MNKRIQELARRAGATDEQGGRAESVFCFTKQELDEFARTLILESADVADRHWMRHKGCSAHFSIREHFGITDFPQAGEEPK